MHPTSEQLVGRSWQLAFVDASASAYPGRNVKVSLSGILILRETSRLFQDSVISLLPAAGTQLQSDRETHGFAPRIIAVWPAEDGHVTEDVDNFEQ